MTFLVQFIRFRRGVPEAIRTLPFAVADAANALARAKGLRSQKALGPCPRCHGGS
jgi:hypothetical protein